MIRSLKFGAVGIFVWASALASGQTPSRPLPPPPPASAKPALALPTPAATPVGAPTVAPVAPVVSIAPAPTNPAPKVAAPGGLGNAGAVAGAVTLNGAVTVTGAVSITGSTPTATTPTPSSPPPSLNGVSVQAAAPGAVTVPQSAISPAQTAEASSATLTGPAKGMTAPLGAVTVPSATGNRRLKNVYANFEIEEAGQPVGKIKVRLFIDKMPKTTANFIGLAEGTKSFKEADASKGKVGVDVTRPFYDGLIFHRVIPNYLIQGGCPYGKGTGGPGFTIQDESVPDLKHNAAGLISMARTSAKDSAGSQFFFTLVAAPQLDAGQSPFGKVVEGLDVLHKMGKSKLARGSEKPLVPLVIKKVTIQREYLN